MKKTLKEHLRSQIDSMQMNVIKQLSNIEQVKDVISLFEQMNNLVENSPEIEVNVEGAAPQKGKRGRKPKVRTNE